LESLRDKNVLSLNPDLFFANSSQIENDYKNAAVRNSNKNENRDKNSISIKTKINDSTNLNKEPILTKSKIDFGDIDSDLI
jgi:hypothetical protein